MNILLYTIILHPYKNFKHYFPLQFGNKTHELRDAEIGCFMALM